MLTVDVHTHILPERIPRWSERFGYGGFIELDHHRPGCARMLRDGALFREIEASCWDGPTRLSECDEKGVSVQVLSTVPVLFGYFSRPKDGLEIARFLNDDIAATVERHPKRFVGLATLPMQDADLAVRELERSVEELGLSGVEVGSNVNGKNLDDPSLFPVFQAAEALGAAVFVHPWEMLGRDRMPDYWLPWLVGMPAETSLAICSMIFGGVFERLPSLRVLFAHGGGGFPATLGRIQHGFDVRPDLCAVNNPRGPKDYLGRFFVDALVHDPALLHFVIDKLGANRVALGSDYPFPLGEDPPGALIRSMDFGDADRARLLHGTALEWLGLEGESFS